MPRFSSGERLVNSIDVIAMTGGGGFRAKMLLTDTLGSFHEMVRFSGPMRILVHDDPIYLKPLHQKGKRFRDNLASRARCLEFRQWLLANSQRLKIDQIIFSDDWQHIGGSIETLLSHVRSPIYCHLEDDFIFLKPINLDAILPCFKNDTVNMIRFNRLRNEVNWWDTILRPCQMAAIDLLAVNSWSFNPSLVRTAKMREFLKLAYVKRYRASEDILVGAYRSDIAANGFEAAHRKWGTFIYGQIGDGPAVQHIGKRVIEESSTASSRSDASGILGAVCKLLPRSNLRVLDLASGDCVWSLPNYRIVRCDRDAREPPAFIQADWRRGLPFRNEAFDGIVAINVIDHVQNPLEFMRECSRVLREYGFIILGILSDPGSGCKWQLEGSCLQAGLTIVSQTYMADGRVLVKALREKSDLYYQQVKRSLTKGWVVTSEPLDDGQVRLEFHRYLEVNVKLKGASPLKQYTVGLNVYGANVPFFGIATRCARNTGWERWDGMSPTLLNGFILGTITTDARGNGKCRFGFPVNPGRYDVQTWLSGGPDGRETTTICYKSGETFGDSNVITIEPPGELAGVDAVIAATTRNEAVLARSVISPSDVVKAFRKRRNPVSLLSKLAKHGPQFLQRFWATPEFLEKYVYGCVPELLAAGRYPESCSATLVDIRRRAITVQYLIGDKRIFAKFYRDEQKGAHSYWVLKTLWDGGFHNGEAYQVSEPLSYARDHRLLLTRGAYGLDVESLSDGVELVNACIRAARWLVKLHRVARRFGNVMESVHNYLRYTEMVVTEASAPFGKDRDHNELLGELIRELRQRARSVLDRHVVVQAHGDFKPEHVFVAQRSVTVIDCDNSAPADPASDIAAFTWRVRKHLFETTGQSTRAETPTRAFLEEYASALPDHVGNLAFYMGCEILWSLAGNEVETAATLEAYVDFHVKEFATAGGLPQDVDF